MTDNYEALSDRALTVLIAETLMGFVVTRTKSVTYWRNAEGELSGFARYAEDDNAARLVLDKIAELGLQSEFISELKKLVICIFSNPRVCEFLDIQASARQKVIAALRAHDQLRAKESVK